MSDDRGDDPHRGMVADALLFCTTNGEPGDARELDHRGLRVRGGAADAVLVRGRFKIFGAEVSGTISRLGRAVAFALGAVLLVVGLLRGSSPTQQGSRFQFVATNAATRYMSRGVGTIDGHRFQSTFQTNLPSIGRGIGSISPDGQQVTGTFQDSVLGQYVLTLYR